MLGTYALDVNHFTQLTGQFIDNMFAWVKPVWFCQAVRDTEYNAKLLECLTEDSFHRTQVQILIEVVITHTLQTTDIPAAIALIFLMSLLIE